MRYGSETVWRVVWLVVGLVCSVSVVLGQTFEDASALLPNQPAQGARLGASAADVNSDGWVDLYRFGHLYRRRGPGVSFEDSHAEAGLTDEGAAVFGGVFGDYNNDGFLDLFIEDLTAPSFLYRNQGDGSFIRSNSEAGVNTDDLFVQGSLWSDLNNDGRLDLFIGNDDRQNQLFLNEDFLTFQDRSDQAFISFDRNGCFGL